MVYIHIQNCDTFMFLSQNFSGDTCIVEVAKSSGNILASVVPRWSAQCVRTIRAIIDQSGGMGSRLR